MPDYPSISLMYIYTSNVESGAANMCFITQRPWQGENPANFASFNFISYVFQLITLLQLSESESAEYEPHAESLGLRLSPGFCSMKRLGVFLPSPGWDASPSQGYSPALNSPVTIYTPGRRARGTVREKCLAREPNTMSPAKT